MLCPNFKWNWLYAVSAASWIKCPWKLAPINKGEESSVLTHFPEVLKAQGYHNQHCVSHMEVILTFQSSHWSTSILIQTKEPWSPRGRVAHPQLTVWFCTVLCSSPSPIPSQRQHAQFLPEEATFQSLWKLSTVNSSGFSHSKYLSGWQIIDNFEHTFQDVFYY